jgi:hypothetical protein
MEVAYFGMWGLGVIELDGDSYELETQRRI